MGKQDEEIERHESQRNGEHSRVKGYNEDGESQDMFNPTQDEALLNEEEKTPTNPFLAAKFRKENCYSANSTIQTGNSFISPDTVDNRNPFKKTGLTPQS